MRPIDADPLRKELQDSRDWYKNTTFDMYDRGASNAYKGAIDILDKQPTIPVWIPVHKSKPVHCDWVIVSVYDERGDTPCEYTSFGHYIKSGGCWVVDSEIRHDVVAWMPLPEPYRGEKQGENN